MSSASNNDRAGGKGVDGDGDIRNLFSFQLQRLAGLSTRIAVLSIQPKFGVTTREWRVLAVLSFLGEATLQELARQTGILKSQLSRTVTGLFERDLISRSGHPSDGRSVLLSLSTEGSRLTASILADSRRRNDQMTAALSLAERQVLIEYMQRVFATSLTIYGDLKLQAKVAPDAFADAES